MCKVNGMDNLTQWHCPIVVVGIFTNYTWKEKAVGESVALAGPRNRDVYTGIDIWGRKYLSHGLFHSCV